MIPDPGAREVERFGNSVARYLGLGFDESRLSSLREVLTDRSQANGLKAADYLSLLETGSSGQVREELRQLAAALTVPETYFFRHAEQIRAFQASCLDPPGRTASAAGFSQPAALRARNRTRSPWPSWSAGPRPHRPRSPSWGRTSIPPCSRRRGPADTRPGPCGRPPRVFKHAGFIRPRREVVDLTRASNRW